MIEVFRNIIYKTRLFFANLFEKDVVIKIGSLIAAIMIWFIVSVTVITKIDRVLYKIPVTVSLDGTYAEANGFQAMSLSADSVTVYIKGERGEIGNLRSEDLIAVASAENVMYAMEYELDLAVKCITNKKEFEVERIEPASVSVKFDRIVTKEVSVVPKLSGIKAADSYIMGDAENIVIVPDTVNITGPAETVDKITSAEVLINESKTLTETTDFKSSDLKFYSGSTAVQNDDGALSFDKSDFMVHVPLYRRYTLALDYKIANAPESFDIESFKGRMDMSVNELEVAVLSENFVDMSTIDIGTIDMRRADIGTVFSFPTSEFLPEGYEDLNNVRYVTVTVPSTGLARRPIHILSSSFQLVNAPPQYDFKINTTGVTPFFIGPEESMEQLTYIDVTAQIDLLTNFDIEEGYHKLPVTFKIQSYNDVWCIGSDGDLSPRVTIEVRLKSNSDG